MTTDQNNAAQPVLTEAALMDLEKQVQHDIPRFGPNVLIGVRAGLLRKMLSKLRAPVGDERAAFEKWTEYTEDALSRDAGDGYCIKGVDNQWRAWQASRATLASAPVAGEAQSEVAKLAEELGDLASDMAYEANQEMDQDKASRAAVIERGERALRRFADAAPQASEAVPGCLLAADHVGMTVDYTGLLGQARSALKRGENAPAMAEMLRQLAVHLTELGQRWYAGDAAVVDEFLQLYCIASDTRAALSAQPGAQKEKSDE